MSWLKGFIIVIMALPLLAGCDLIYGENSVQKERTQILLNRVASVLPADGSARLTGLTNYHALCAERKPKIPQEGCIELVIDSGSLVKSESLVGPIIKYTQELFEQGKLSELKGCVIIILPVSRLGGFDGRATPHSLSRKNFSVGNISHIYLGRN